MDHCLAGTTLGREVDSTLTSYLAAPTMYCIRHSDPATSRLQQACNRNQALRGKSTRAHQELLPLSDVHPALRDHSQNTPGLRSSPAQADPFFCRACGASDRLIEHHNTRTRLSYQRRSGRTDAGRRCRCRGRRAAGGGPAAGGAAGGAASSSRGTPGHGGASRSQVGSGVGWRQRCQCDCSGLLPTLHFSAAPAIPILLPLHSTARRNRGKGQYGCPHYRRRVKFITPCWWVGLGRLGKARWAVHVPLASAFPPRPRRLLLASCSCLPRPLPVNTNPTCLPASSPAVAMRSGGAGELAALSSSDCVCVFVGSRRCLQDGAGAKKGCGWQDEHSPMCGRCGHHDSCGPPPSAAPQALPQQST